MKLEWTATLSVLYNETKQHYYCMAFTGSGMIPQQQEQHARTIKKGELKKLYLTITHLRPTKNLHLILLASSCLLCKPRYMVNDGGKVGGSPQFNWLESCVVGLDHPRYAGTVGVLGIPIQSKLMGHLRTINWRCRRWKKWPNNYACHTYRAADFCSKSKCWK